jgi:hypothetical protein
MLLGFEIRCKIEKKMSGNGCQVFVYGQKKSVSL